MHKFTYMHYKCNRNGNLYFSLIHY